ncbi:MAG: dienelactone hydrolase family protein, partial [Pseudomonadota bacterium]|nr:dienelactone hydrolase family protein [Pseudomonadota bacterium]
MRDTPGPIGAEFSKPSMDAPQLAYWGDFPVGVRQLEFVDANRPDYLDIDPETGAPVNKDRLIDALIWYPAIEDDQRASDAVYTRRFVQDPAWPMPDFPTEWQTSGAAITDAQPIAGTKFPVVLLIHGWGGNEVSLAYLGENLASKGYIAISPDLRDVEPDDPQVFELLFPRAMLNRAQDIRFIADEIEAKADEPDALLGAIANPDSFAIIANSLGGLGAVRVAGAGYQAASPGAGWVPGNLLGDQTEGAENSSEFLLPELDALVLIAPWGAQDGVSLFSDEALSRVDVPLMVIAGDQDSIAGYETGPRRIY